MSSYFMRRMDQNPLSNRNFTRDPFTALDLIYPLECRSLHRVPWMNNPTIPDKLAAVYGKYCVIAYEC